MRERKLRSGLKLARGVKVKGKAGWVYNEAARNQQK
jgi:hypothetical protein